MNWIQFSGLAALILLVPWVPLSAHHGTSGSYDQSRVVKLEDVVVKEFRWRNPHSALFLAGKNESGEAVIYSLEMGSPNTLVRFGYRRDTFKPGDKVTIEMYPSRSNPTSGESLSSRPISVNGKLVKAAVADKY